MVVILAAGKGSRMNLPAGVSKCSVKLPDGRSSVQRLIDQFKELGEDWFVLVVGYGATSVSRSLDDLTGAVTTCIYNTKYEWRGCEYSLASAAYAFSCEEDVIIVEGDLVTTTENLRAIVESRETSVLVRPASLLSKKSVAVACDDTGSRVVKFLYDQDHQFDMRSLEKVVPRIYDSFQVWKISKEDVPDFKKGLLDYKKQADSKDSDYRLKMASGLLTINSHIINHSMTVRQVPKPLAWINLNSEDDIKSLNSSECLWYTM